MGALDIVWCSYFVWLMLSTQRHPGRGDTVGAAGKRSSLNIWPRGHHSTKDLLLNNATSIPYGRYFNITILAHISDTHYSNLS